MINKAEQKNKIILAFVIALCLAAILWATGVIDILKAIIKVIPKEMPTVGAAGVKPISADFKEAMQ